MGHPMRFLALTLPSLAENLALDEALLLGAEAGQAEPTLRVWEWRAPAVVLGAVCDLARDVQEAACRAGGVPVLRRSSGGGTVLLDKGCLCYSLVLAFGQAPELSDIRSSYRHLLGRVRDALRDAVPAIEVAGISDLAVAGQKCAGSAQQRKRQFLLHHGTLLYDFNLSLVGRYLRQPARQPEYRQDRPHAAFLTNLPLAAAEVTRRLRAAWQADEEISAWPADSVRELVGTKYDNPAWTRRR
jgi:lipoate-protein ligase A